MQLPMEALFDSGHGVPIIILTGNIYNFIPWIPLLKYFSITHRIVIPRLPFHNNPLTMSRMEDLVQHLNRFIRVHTVHKFICIGSGAGSNIALHYTKQFPETIQKLILTRPFENKTGIYVNTIIDEKAGGESDMYGVSLSASDLPTQRYYQNTFLKEEVILKDVFFRIYPFPIPAKLILSDCSYTYIRKNEIDLTIHSKTIERPVDLIEPIVRFLSET